MIVNSRWAILLTRHVTICYHNGSELYFYHFEFVRRSLPLIRLILTQRFSQAHEKYLKQEIESNWEKTFFISDYNSGCVHPRRHACIEETALFS